VNSQLSAFPTFSAPTKRAHLSPASRRATARAIYALGLSPAIPPASSTSPTSQPTPNAALPGLGRIWTPHLLDRLRTPLTRYRE